MFDWTLIYQSLDQKVTWSGGSMLALFTKETLPDSFGKCQGSCYWKAVSSALAFIWHLTEEIGKKKFKATYESCYDKLTHHPSLSHFHLLIFCLLKTDIQSLKKSLWLTGVNNFFSTPWRSVCVMHHLLVLGLSGTSASNIKSRGRHSWMNHKFMFQGIQTKYTTQQDNWKEISILLGNSVLSVYVCY